ncbi:NAD(P)H-binding protein [Winogradskyella sp.]|uniref:NAD(P)H-binding protein n=1 Tax=Winogradskyella sp. TaxID=1883156 RepID=UPI003BABF86F
METQISIIGCGWLGLPLAKTLISHGYKVKGSTTSKDKLDLLAQAGIDGFLIRLDNEGLMGNYTEFLSGSDIVIINIPPGLRKDPSKNHVAELQHFILAIKAHNIPKVLYVSSTSVFKDDTHFPIIDHNTRPNGISNSAKQLIAIENMLRDHKSFNTTIIRFGGLFDAKRHPARYLSGRQHISNPEAPINLIHKSDCIAIISAIVKNNLWNLRLNAVFPQHPSKKEYYSAYCKTHDLELPTFNLSEKSIGKIIDSSELERLLNYNFEHGL